MNSKDKGDLGELIVMTQALTKGYTVCKPFGDNKRYDLLFDKDGVFSRIQVKHINPDNKGRISLSLFTVMHNSDKKAKQQYTRVQYTSKEVDFIAIVNAHNNEVYMIPMTELDGQSTLRLRTPDCSLRENKTVRISSNYTHW